MDESFKDKKTTKGKLWQKIADALNQKGFIVGQNAAERCRQKFSNLTKAYLNYIKHQKTTGAGDSMEVPPFFDELHSLLNSKHKINPSHLEDSMEIVEPTTDNTTESALDTEETENVAPSDQENALLQSIGERFTKARKRVRPMGKSAVLQELRELRKSRESDSEFLKEHLKKTEDQRDRFLQILENAFSRKRNRDDLSDTE